MKQRKLQNIFLKAGAVLIALVFSISIHAQNNQQARKILDKTAAPILILNWVKPMALSPLKAQSFMHVRHRQRCGSTAKPSGAT